MQIVLDDFGAGHSSLAYLHRLPIAGLKIDRSFIEPLATDAQAVAIVRSIVALAQTLDLYTVAEAWKRPRSWRSAPPRRPSRAGLLLLAGPNLDRSLHFSARSNASWLPGQVTIQAFRLRCLSIAFSPYFARRHRLST